MHCKISKPRGKTLHGLQTLVVYDIVLDPTTTIDRREIPGSLLRFLDPFFGLTWSSGIHVTESLELSGLSRQGQKDRKDFLNLLGLAPVLGSSSVHLHVSVRKIVRCKQGCLRDSHPLRLRWESEARRVDVRRIRLDFCVSGLWLDGMQSIEIPMRYTRVSAWIFALHGSQT